MWTPARCTALWRSISEKEYFPRKMWSRYVLAVQMQMLRSPMKTAKQQVYLNGENITARLREEAGGEHGF